MVKGIGIWLWLIPLTLLWPGLHLLVFFLRFGHIRDVGSEAYVFLPMGLLSGIILIALWKRATTRRQKAGLALGYLLAMPFAFIGSLFSGLMLPPFVGTVICGVPPLVAGMGIGYVVARGYGRTDS